MRSAAANLVPSCHLGAIEPEEEASGGLAEGSSSVFHLSVRDLSRWVGWLGPELTASAADPTKRRNLDVVSANPGDLRASHSPKAPRVAVDDLDRAHDLVDPELEVVAVSDDLVGAEGGKTLQDLREQLGSVGRV